MDNQSHRFFRTWLCTFVGFVTVITVFNATMDPYLLFNTTRITGVNVRKSEHGVMWHEPLVKAYDVLRAEPNTLLLGSSTVGFGLDAQHSEWPEQNRPVYNLSFAGGGGPYMAYRNLQHVMSKRHPTLVVLGLDFEFFLTGKAYLQLGPEFESRLAVTRNGNINVRQARQHIRDLLQATLSMDALADSIETLVGNANGTLQDFNAGNAPSIVMQRITAAWGENPIVVQDLRQIRRYHGQRKNELIMPYVQAIIDLCEAHNTSVVLLINPVHADMLDILDLLGFWQEFEDWKRELVALTAQYRGTDGRSRIPLWDFTGYNSYSTELVPEQGHGMKWWDTNHYTHALGDVIVRQIFGADVHFGVLLSGENIESHLGTIREQQYLYRARRPAGVQRLRYLYGSTNLSHDMVGR